MGRIGFGASTNTSSNLSSDFIVETALSGVASERMRIDSSGNVALTGNEQELKFHSNYSVGNTDRAKIKAIGAGGGSGYGGDLVFYTKATTNTYGERMRIDSSGNIGVGDTSPSSHYSEEYRLVLRDDQTATTQMTITNATSGSGAKTQYKMIGGTSNSFGGWVLDDNNGSPYSDLSFGNAVTHLQIGLNGSERMRIDNSGNVGIGTTSPSNKLTVSSGGMSPSARFSRNTDGTSRTVVYFYSDSNSSTVGSIGITDSATSYNTSSDHRLKENVTNVTDGITRVKQLAPKRFNFIADPDDTTVDGFLAHEVQTVVPEAITGTHNEVDADSNPVYQGIDQSKLVPLLTAALQEAIAKIETLETKVAALEAN